MFYIIFAVNHHRLFPIHGSSFKRVHPLCGIGNASSSVHHNKTILVKRMCTQYSFLNQQLDNNVRIINNYCLYFVLIYINEDLKPQVKIGTSSGHVALNEMQWFILVTFKSNIAKNEVHELGNPRHTLSVNCRRNMSITSKKHSSVSK